MCAKTGYKGRLALHEVMSVTEEIERLAVDAGLRRRRSPRRPARRAWSRCAMDGMAKVADGVTSIDEILRVVV